MQTSKSSTSNDWQLAGFNVGIGCPGAMQQAKHMADAAVEALSLPYDETAPVDIKASIDELRRERDRYKAWLDELLAVIHRDGGQYTQLTGYLVSLQDAQKKVVLLRKKVSSMLFKPGRR